MEQCAAGRGRGHAGLERRPAARCAPTNASAGKWRQVGEREPVTVGRNGSGWGLGLHPDPQTHPRAGPVKREGDGRSPAGVFGIGDAFGYAGHADTALPYDAMQASHYCMDVSGSPLYNRIVDARSVGTEAVAGSTEPMRLDLHAAGDQRYRQGFVIEHNPQARRRCRQLHLRPFVEEACRIHRRLHRYGRSDDEPAAGMAATGPASGLRAVAGPGIRRAARCLATPPPGVRALKPTTRVLLGLASGAVIGLTLAWLDPSLAAKVAAIVQPIGKLWLNALQMTVVPLVFALVIIGVTTASDTASSGRTARRALLVFVILLSAASFFTAFAAPLLLSQVPRSPAVTQAFGSVAAAPIDAATAGWSDALTAIIPSNAVCGRGCKARCCR